MDTTLLVLAAGMGSRYGGLKQLDTFGPGENTIMDYSVRDAIEAGFNKVVFVIRREFESEFRSHISKKYEDQIRVEHVFQEMEIEGFETIQRTKPWGTGHAILSASSVINEPFAVINADDFYGKSSFQSAFEFLQKECTPSLYGMVAFILKKTLSPYGAVSRGVCTVDDHSLLKKVEEHSGIAEKNGKIIGLNSSGVENILDEKTLVSMNLWMFHQDIFKGLKKRFHEFVKENMNQSTTEFYIPSYVDEELNKGHLKVRVLTSDDKWYGVTYREDRDRVNRALNEMHSAGVY